MSGDLFPAPPRCCRCGAILAPALPVVAYVRGWGLCGACEVRLVRQRVLDVLWHRVGVMEAHARVS